MSHSSNRSESSRDENRYRERDSRKSDESHSQKRKESNYKDEERPSKRLDSKSYSDTVQQSISSTTSSNNHIVRDITQVDWKEHQKFLDNLFFKKSDIIQFNTPHYNDFWYLHSSAAFLTIKGLFLINILLFVEENLTSRWIPRRKVFK